MALCLSVVDLSFSSSGLTYFTRVVSPESSVVIWWDCSNRMWFVNSSQSTVPSLLASILRKRFPSSCALLYMESEPTLWKAWMNSSSSSAPLPSLSASSNAVLSSFSVSRLKLPPPAPPCGPPTSDRSESPEGSARMLPLRLLRAPRTSAPTATPSSTPPPSRAAAEPGVWFLYAAPTEREGGGRRQPPQLSLLPCMPTGPSELAPAPPARAARARGQPGGERCGRRGRGGEGGGGESHGGPGRGGGAGRGGAGRGGAHRPLSTATPKRPPARASIPPPPAPGICGIYLRRIP